MPRRYATLAVAAFGGLAIVLAFVGVYATVSHVMAGWRREIAIRMTIGAAPREIYASRSLKRVAIPYRGWFLASSSARPQLDWSITCSMGSTVSIRSRWSVLPPESV